MFSPRSRDILIPLFYVIITLLSSHALAQLLPSEDPVIDAFEKPVSGLTAGSFRQVVLIAIPAFKGIEPRLSLFYASGASNGFCGVGWALTGFGTFSRTKNGRGIPRFDDRDVFLFGGQELVPCAEAENSPSCMTGGSHATKDESYLRLRYNESDESWSVWAKNGTRTDYSPVYRVPEGIYR